jgi:hypothetical protein
MWLVARLRMRTTTSTGKASKLISVSASTFARGNASDKRCKRATAVSSTVASSMFLGEIRFHSQAVFVVL